MAVPSGPPRTELRPCALQPRLPPPHRKTEEREGGGRKKEGKGGLGGRGSVAREVRRATAPAAQRTPSERASSLPTIPQRGLVGRDRHALTGKAVRSGHRDDFTSEPAPPLRVPAPPSPPTADAAPPRTDERGREEGGTGRQGKEVIEKQGTGLQHLRIASPPECSHAVRPVETGRQAFQQSDRRRRREVLRPTRPPPDPPSPCRGTGSPPPPPPQIERKERRGGKGQPARLKTLKNGPGMLTSSPLVERRPSSFSRTFFASERRRRRSEK